jgi:hypothetical protein
MQELWRPVVGLEQFYAVSSSGNVKRLAHENTVTGHPNPKYTIARLPERILNPTSGKNGYYSVVLKKRRYYVHTLVLEAFVGPRPSGLIACHGPAGRRVNTPDNLSWGTYSQNAGIDMIRDGTIKRGEKAPTAKLTEADVSFIRKNAGKITHQSMADKLGVARTTVSCIVQGCRWSHLL